jgi:ribonuclease HI
LNSSPAGWGAVIRNNAAEEGKFLIGTLEATMGHEFEHQVR